MKQSSFSEQLQRLKIYTTAANFSNPKVTKTTAYWQVHHTLLVLNGVATVLRNSNPADFKPKGSFFKFLIMNTGWIPRGKGKAPAQTRPESTFSQQELLDLLDTTAVNLATLDTINSGACFRHPLFGWLDKKDTIRFMKIHTNHHLKILKDMRG